MRTFDSSLQSGIILDKWKRGGEKKINLQIINQYPYSHYERITYKKSFSYLMKINHCLKINLVLDIGTIENMHSSSLLSKLVNPLRH